jgi:hypothetical protein
MKRSIVQLDLDGNIINTFESITEASRITGISEVCFNQVLNGKRKTTHGYSFRYNDQKPKRKYNCIKYSVSFQNHNNMHKRQVLQFDEAGNYIATYESISAASKATGISTWQISAVCNHYRKISHGFIFKFNE